MIFSIPTMVAFITKNFTLYPGDIISTGTPSGVGKIRHGDVVEVEIEKIGVFVNQEVDEVAQKVHRNRLAGVQLHGEETPSYVESLRTLLNDEEVKIIKAFPVGNVMDWESVKVYETLCDYFLFDTKGKDRGGNGIQFDWNLLADYPLKKEYFLSGGIGPDDLDALKAFRESDQSGLCHAIDVNSRFELFPGMKDVEKLKLFIKDFKAIRL